ncbi:hypothetical protein J2Y45_006481 [Dyadobacter sp. BE34]|uniref:Lipoprotein n=1 Tax=Dyadobacter fermentans TaxID=94254 RepID=A0ABU1QXN6_9BACT|nr:MULTISPECIES: hypothetical protein [Dyadobacter]MDR6805919.1 hypothetical protein [Dyadobacter fermentans]MDR7042320.1 hypothetical protein [Dyadobacter sp. BE242]MDR7201318.1 hypothetical protein [Dyadobacter sp. BE34]MDR7215933.1 hypothetical protein [Dyadobacter sp. BE31]MDR7263469.1 hypothetical protein [Dyadobacter sp. BE32]
MKALCIIPILILSMLASLCVSCSDDVVVANEQEIYFEIHYTNQAWGNQFKGFLIDKDGQVRTYDKPASWNDVELKSTISKPEMEANIAQTTIAATRIAAGDLDKYVSASRKIKGDSLSKPANGGADLGLTRFYAYTYDADKKTYSALLLRQIGNVIIHNQDANAQVVADWLTKVMDEVY